MAGGEADQGFGDEPRGHAHAEVGALHTLGGDGGRVLVQLGAPEDLTDREDDHHDDSHVEVAAGHVAAEPAPGECEDEQRQRADDGAEDQHLENVEPPDDRDGQDDADHDADWVDGAQEPHLDIRADDPNPVFRHQQICVGEDGPNTENRDHEDQQSVERGLTDDGLQVLDEAEFLLRWIGRSGLFSIFFFVGHLLFAADQEDGGEQREEPAEESDGEDVTVVDLEPETDAVDDQVAGHSRTKVHDHVPQAEAGRAAALRAEAAVGRLEDRDGHGHARRCQHEEADSQPESPGAAGPQTHEGQTATRDGLQTDGQEHGLADPEPVGEGTDAEQDQGGGDGHGRDDVAGMHVVQAHVGREEDCADGQQGEVGGRVQQVDDLDGPVDHGVVPEDAEVLDVPDDWRQDAVALVFGHLVCSLWLANDDRTDVSAFRP